MLDRTIWHHSTPKLSTITNWKIEKIKLSKSTKNTK